MPLRVGVIGCGNIAQIMHIPYLMEYEQFDLVALADTYQPILDAVGNRYGIARRYTDWRELVNADDIDAVVVCHAGSHRDSIIASLDAGKHVLVEKPVAWNLREVEEVAARAATSDRILQIGYHKRYDPAFQVAREQVRAMDDIGLVRISVMHPPDEMGHSPFRIRRGDGVVRDGHIDALSWEEYVTGALNGLAGGDVAAQVDEALGTRKENPQLRIAYGMLTISLIHQVYMLFGFLGKPQAVVSTEVWREGMSLHSIMEYPNDLRVTLDWHFLSKLKIYTEEYAFYGNSQRVFMRLPSPYLKNFPSPVIVQAGEGELAYEKTITVSYDEAFRNELLAFYDNVQNGTVPATPITESVEHAALIQGLIDVARVVS